MYHIAQVYTLFTAAAFLLAGLLLRP